MDHPITRASMDILLAARYFAMASVAELNRESRSWEFDAAVNHLETVAGHLGYDLVKREEKKEAA
jgi:hypothetical protein